MTNLKEVNFGLNQYCGPAVLSALTGKSTDECASVIAAISGSREIKAVLIKDLLKALEKLRFTSTKIEVPAYSLFGTLSILSRTDGLYVIAVPRHVVAVEVINNQIYLIDNHTKQAIDAKASARLTQKVDLVYKVMARPIPEFISTHISTVIHSRSIDIVATDIYRDDNDNIKRQLGYIYYRDIQELENIINELAKIGQTP